MALDQPTAENALEELEALVGTWKVQATPPGGEPWPGDAEITYEWMEGSDQRLLVERSWVEMPEAPNGFCVFGCDAASGRYFQLYTDDRNVCRVYEVSIGNGEMRIWRDGEPFSQRFTGKFSEDGNRIEARWEAAKDGTNWETDFDLVFTRVK
jgi:hypothetical protein